MFAVASLICSLAFFFRSFLRPSITSVKTNPDPVAIETLGAMPTAGSLAPLFQALQQNASPAFGNFGLAIYGGGNANFTAQDMLGTFIRHAAIAASSDVFDTGANVVGAIPGAKVGQSWLMALSNLSSIGGITLNGNTGVTLTGSMTVSRLSTRLFLGRVTGSAAYTVTNMFEFSSPIL